MIHVVNQLPQGDRYTDWWYQMFLSHTDLFVLGRGYTTLSYREQSYNTFANLDEAVRYEADQIVALLQIGGVRNVLIADLSFPGLISAAIPVIKLKLNEVKFHGILHAGSYCNGDIFSRSEHKAELERIAIAQCENVFVATEYHKHKVSNALGVDSEKLVVLGGMPFFPIPVMRPNSGKKPILVVGRREQASGVKIRGAEYHYDLLPRWEFLDKLSSYQVVVIDKIEETFGYTALEALAVGCIPLAPKRYAYLELLPEELLYENGDHLKQLVKDVLKDPRPYHAIAGKVDLYQYEGVLDRMIEVICTRFVGT
jgi:hypothetical protein